MVNFTPVGTLPEAGRVHAVLVSQTPGIGGETFDGRTDFLVGQIQVALNLPQHTVRPFAVRAVAKRAVHKPRLQATVDEATGHTTRADVNLVEVETEEGLHTPAVFLLTVCLGEQVVAVEQTTVKWRTVESHTVNKQLFGDGDPGRLDHNVTELTVLLDGLGLGGTGLAKVTEDRGVVFHTFIIGGF